MAQSSEKGEGISRSGEDDTAPLKAGPSNSGSSVQPCSPKPGPSNSGITKEGAPNPLLMPTDTEHQRKRLVECIFHPSY